MGRTQIGSVRKYRDLVRYHYGVDGILEITFLFIEIEEALRDIPDILEDIGGYHEDERNSTKRDPSL